MLCFQIPLSFSHLSPKSCLKLIAISTLHQRGKSYAETKSFRESINQHCISTNPSIVSTDPKEPWPQIWTNPYPVWLAILDHAHPPNWFKANHRLICRIHKEVQGQKRSLASGIYLGQEHQSCLAFFIFNNV